MRTSIVSLLLILAASGPLVLQGRTGWVDMPIPANDLVISLPLDRGVVLILKSAGYFEVTRQIGSEVGPDLFRPSGFALYQYSDLEIVRQTGSSNIKVTQEGVSPRYYRYEVNRRVWQRWAGKRPPGDNRWF